MNLINESNDKKYFTIVPNFILNHSSATDQALYLQMKRIAGDNGITNASERYFRKQLNIGRTAFASSLAYLIEHKWIDKLGKAQIQTSGGLQLVNVYRVNDLWKMNTEYYDRKSKGGSKTTPLIKTQGVSKSTSRCVQINKRGADLGTRRRTKEELKKKENFSLENLKSQFKEKTKIPQ